MFVSTPYGGQCSPYTGWNSHLDEGEGGTATPSSDKGVVVAYHIGLRHHQRGKR